MSAPQQPSGPFAPQAPPGQYPPAAPAQHGPAQGLSQGPPQGPTQGPIQGPNQGPSQGGPLQGGGPLQAPQQVPPGYGYPPAGGANGWPAPTQQLPAAAPGASTVWVLGLVSVIAVVAGLSISEDGRNAWDSVNAWGGLAVVGAILAAAGAWGPTFGLRGGRAPQLALVGAGLLGLFWVLLVLPSVGSNTSLVTSVGVLAGAAAAWKAQPDSGHGGGGAQGGPGW